MKESWLKVCFVSILSISLIFATVSCNTEKINLSISKGQSTNLGLDSTEALPAVESFENLVKIFARAVSNPGYGNRVMYTMSDDTMAMEADRSGVASAPTAAGGKSYSTTNVQVQGVDEADIIKTDGEFIYQANNDKIIIARVYPADKMEIVKTLSLSSEQFYPSELYLDSKYLVVIGGSNRVIPFPEPKEGNDSDPSPNTGAAKDISEPKPADMPIRGIAPIYNYNYRNTTKIYIYDITQPEDAHLVRELEVDGYSVSSRKIGSQLYFITNQYMNYYHPMDSAEPTQAELFVPGYRDSNEGKDYTMVDYSAIHYFPDSEESNYLTITGLNLDKIDEQANITSYLGSGQTIYATQENLYIAVTKWEYEEIEPEPSSAIDETNEGKAVPVPDSSVSTQPSIGIVMPIMPIMPRLTSVKTYIYRFALDEGKVEFAAKGEVPGTLLNQFSMDEHNGFFRVATTIDQGWWGAQQPSSSNNLYILDNKLDITGKIENIAPGERIYSVRFMGDKGYMVTFRTVDPLFVLDLKNPEQPKILGELKIPGYSDYLHPYDENHIIGFGMDAIEADIKDEKGNVIAQTAYQTGMKIAMFDVSDVNNPKEKFNVKIGDRGTYSDVLYNHKALLFNRDKDILAFPVTVYKAKEQWADAERQIPEYGTFAFQGYYVFGMDLNKGFDLKAQITHLTSDELARAKDYWFDYQKTVERAVYIDDTLYTVSKAYIKAHDMNDYNEIDTLKLPVSDIGY